eukprot:1721716-Rhodomonas_salina.3
MRNCFLHVPFCSHKRSLTRNNLTVLFCVPLLSHLSCFCIQSASNRIANAAYEALVIFVFCQCKMNHIELHAGHL